MGSCGGRGSVSEGREWENGDQSGLFSMAITRWCCLMKSARSPGTRHGYDSFFIRFNSVLENFDSTQLITHNGFTRIDSNQLMTQNGLMKFDSNRLTT